MLQQNQQNVHPLSIGGTHAFEENTIQKNKY